MLYFFILVSFLLFANMGYSLGADISGNDLISNKLCGKLILERREHVLRRYIVYCAMILNQACRQS